jgi:hypothetical protein
LHKVGTHTTANFQKPGTAIAVKSHHLRHPGSILLVPVTFDGVKKFARAKFHSLSIEGTTGVGTPLFASTLFFFN